VTLIAATSTTLAVVNFFAALEDLGIRTFTRAMTFLSAAEAVAVEFIQNVAMDAVSC
jgi:hypothetical protein